MNVLVQLDHLRSYSVVADALDREALSIDGWFFDVGTGEIEEWSPLAQRFEPLRVSPEDKTPEPPSERPGGSRRAGRPPRRRPPAP